MSFKHATEEQIAIIASSGLDRTEFNQYGGQNQYWSFEGKDDDHWIRTNTVDGDKIARVLRKLMPESAWGECQLDAE